MKPFAIALLFAALHSSHAAAAPAAPDADALSLRRQETVGLVRALAAESDDRRDCWVRQALGARRERYERIGGEAAASERATERAASLAAAVPPPLTAADFPAAAGHDRAQATGVALAALLAAIAPDWKQALERDEGQSLDGLLAARVGTGERCRIERALRSRLARAAAQEVAGPGGG